MPIFTGIIGAIVLFLITILKQTFNLTVVNTTKKEVPMKDKTKISTGAILRNLFIAIGSNVTVGWLLSARFLRMIFLR